MSILVISVALLSFMTGVVSKLSDLFNDDGLTGPSWADPLSGVVWAATGSALVLLDGRVGAVWVATVLYWFLRMKLDHFNHAVAGVAIAGCGVYMASTGSFSIPVFASILGWLALSGYLNTWAKERLATTRPWLTRFLRLRVRYYAGPVVVSVVTLDVLPAVTILCGMVGTELVTAWGKAHLSIPVSAPDRAMESA